MQEKCTKSPSVTLPSSVPSSKSLSSSKDKEFAHNLQESVKHSIFYLSEQLRVEKVNRDENTVSYLKLVSKADWHQALHIWWAFEKVNQRASANIAQIEQRLHQCYQQLQKLEKGLRPKHSVLKVESSLDNYEKPSVKGSVSELPRLSGEDDLLATQLDVARPFTWESHFSGLQQWKFSELKPVAQQQKLLLQKVKEELTEVRKFHIDLHVSYQSVKERYLTDLQVSLESLQEEKRRQALMEEQVNDHLQGHMDEIYYLKQHLAYTEEKMACLTYGRDKEIWEVIETFKSRISKLETLQQVNQLETMANLRSCPQEFLFRFISLLLTLTSILVVFVFTVCSCPLPLISSRLCTCTAVMLLGLGALAWQKLHTMGWQTWVPAR